MVREYVAGHKFNGVRWQEETIDGNKKKICFIKGAIRCDEKLQAFAVWGHTLDEAQKEFDRFLNSRCICVWRSDVSKCPVHRNG